MIAVLLIGFGGPECLEDVGPFVERVTGRELPPERLAASVDKYRRIGGGSPLCGISRRQAGLLESALRDAGREAKVFLGMRYWHPGIDEAATAASAARPEQIVVMCLTPYYSSISSGDYLKAAGEALEKAGAKASVREIKAWNTEPNLIEAFAEELRKTVEETEDGTEVIFTAHSLPMSLVDEGNPYAKQVKETAKLTAAAAGVDKWRLGWQSEGRGRGEWLKPAVDEVLAEVRSEGASGVVIAPIGFISDHVETLYDLDIVLKRQAQELGLDYKRVHGLNDSELLAAGMASAIIKELNSGGI